VRVAVCVVETEATVAVKAPVDAPAATATFAGRVTLALLLDSATLAPAAAAALSVTVHAEVPGARTLAGMQFRLLTVSVEIVRTKVLETPPKVAVRVAVCAVETEATVAVKAPVDAPVATATFAGTVTLALLLDSATLAPAAAAALSVTVHAEVPGARTLAGMQLRLLTVSVGEIVRTKV